MMSRKHCPSQEDCEPSDADDILMSACNASPPPESPAPNNLNYNNHLQQQQQQQHQVYKLSNNLKLHPNKNTSPTGACYRLSLKRRPASASTVLGGNANKTSSASSQSTTLRSPFTRAIHHHHQHAQQQQQFDPDLLPSSASSAFNSSPCSPVRSVASNADSALDDEYNFRTVIEQLKTLEHNNNIQNQHGNRTRISSPFSASPNSSSKKLTSTSKIHQRPSSAATVIGAQKQSNNMLVSPFVMAHQKKRDRSVLMSTPLAEESVNTPASAPPSYSIQSCFAKKKPRKQRITSAKRITQSPSQFEDNSNGGSDETLTGEDEPQECSMHMQPPMSYRLKAASNVNSTPTMADSLPLSPISTNVQRKKKNLLYSIKTGTLSDSEQQFDNENSKTPPRHSHLFSPHKL